MSSIVYDLFIISGVNYVMFSINEKSESNRINARKKKTISTLVSSRHKQFPLVRLLSLAVEQAIIDYQHPLK